MGNTWRGKETMEAALSAFYNHPEVIFFDTETTGLDASADRIVELAAIRCEFDKNGGLLTKDRLHVYIRPPFAMPEKASEVNGITDEFLADKPAWEDVFPEVNAFFSDTPVAAYNAGFDVKFMRAMYGLMGESFDPKTILDILPMARDFLAPEETGKKYNLGAVSHALGVDNGIVFHGAMDDTTVMIRCADIFFRDYVRKANEPQEIKPLKRPLVFGVSYWPGFRGYPRIYANTSLGSFFYDIRGKRWGAKNENVDDVDMDFVREEVFRITGTQSEEELGRFKGSA